MTEKIFDQFCYAILIILFGVALGYWWRMHHEGKIKVRYQAEAEKQIESIKQSFQDDKSFTLFGNIKVWKANQNPDKCFAKARR